MNSTPRKKNAVLIIDGQFDFCNPKGALSVKGADEDNKRLSTFINNNASEIDEISFTLDIHQVNDVSHPPLWKDKNGNHPNPGTPISYASIEAGDWTPTAYDREIREYVRRLEELAQEEIKNGIPFPILSHFIWPLHCLFGSKGAALDDTLMDAIVNWSSLNPYNVYHGWPKGTNPLTEHFGAFRAQIPHPKYPETQLNQKLIKLLEDYDNVFFAGQAKSHCVATTLKQAIFEAPELAKKFVILEDCMSDVVIPGAPDFGAIAQPIYDLAKKNKLRFEKSTQIVLSQIGATV